MSSILLLELALDQECLATNDLLRPVRYGGIDDDS